MKRAIVVLLIAVVHAVLTVAAALKTFEISGFMFGIYPKPSEGPVHTAFVAAYTVLMSPLGLVAESLGPGMRFLELPLIILNSLLWAVVIYLLVVRRFRRGKHQRPQSAA